MLHVSMTSSGMKRGEQSGSPVTILRSAILCIRGSRSSHHRPKHELNITLASHIRGSCSLCCVVDIPVFKFYFFKFLLSFHSKVTSNPLPHERGLISHLYCQYICTFLLSSIHTFLEKKKSITFLFYGSKLWVHSLILRLPTVYHLAYNML